jgi:hypothetical protein
MHGGTEAFTAVPLALVIAEHHGPSASTVTASHSPRSRLLSRTGLWWGLESSIDDLLACCRKRPDVQAPIKAEISTVAEQGRPKRGKGSDHSLF